MSEQAEWVSWIIGRGNYGRTHLVAASGITQYGEFRPLVTECGRDVGSRWRLGAAGLRCMKCHAISKARGEK